MANRFFHGDKVRHTQTKREGKILAIGNVEYYGEPTYGIEWFGATQELTTFERGVPGKLLELVTTEK